MTRKQQLKRLRREVIHLLNRFPIYGGSLYLAPEDYIEWQKMNDYFDNWEADDPVTGYFDTYRKFFEHHTVVSGF